MWYKYPDWNRIWAVVCNTVSYRLVMKPLHVRRGTSLQMYKQGLSAGILSAGQSC